MPAAKRAIKGETYGYAIDNHDNGTIDIIGLAHTRGYNAYPGKDWSVIAIEALRR